uniref:Guanine nucleotide-binding protein subunit gamma n=2 Tax=Estrildinae TaxID=40155 RepID=H0YSQ2_TAEGU
LCEFHFSSLLLLVLSPTYFLPFPTFFLFLSFPPFFLFFIFSFFLSVFLPVFPPISPSFFNSPLLPPASHFTFCFLFFPFVFFGRAVTRRFPTPSGSGSRLRAAGSGWESGRSAGIAGGAAPAPAPPRGGGNGAEPAGIAPFHPRRFLCGFAMSSGGSLSTMQRLVEQLKLEAAVERIKVSQAAAELQQYCMQNACKDALLVGVPTGSNPFREPRSCALL